jgi:hypothetical protein
MKTTRAVCSAIVFATLFLMAPPAVGQIVINEIVEDEQDFESTDDIADTGEFVELYNAGASAVDISGWTLTVKDFAATPTVVTDTFPSGSIVPAGGYFVLGGPDIPAGPNVYKPFAGELWGGVLNAKAIFELRNPATTLVDAVALDTFRGDEIDTATQEQIDQIAAGQTAGPGARGGWWGQVETNRAHPSDTVNYPNLPLSLGRYRDGYDHNVNGRDFGMIPATPGASNNLAEVPVHAVPDVDAVAVGTNLRDDYYASFKLPRVINPTVVGPTFGGANINPSAIPASPQGGRAIIAWDETGGGNVAYSDEYSNEFKLYAYIDPTPLANTTNTSTNSEATVYGIAGTSDIFFGTPNSADLLTGQPGTGGNITSSANGSTGLGWLIQRRTSRDAGGVNSSAAVLQLLDMNDGGDGVIADNDWQIEASIDLTGMAAGWHVLGIDYDPVTGNVTAVYDNQTFNFTTTTDLVGNFYVGWRENMPGTGSAGRPPTYDLFVETAQDGDYNGDGKVDAADYVAWRKTPGNFGGDPGGYDTWRANFGEGGPGGGGAVPEPASMLLIAVGLVGAAMRRVRS